MPDKKPEQFKTEEELKREARERHEQELQLAAAKPKSASEKKRENYWYHYKWHTIAGILLVILLTVFVKDIFFRKQPDVTIAALTQRYISEESIEALTTAIGEKAAEFNDGEKILAQIDLITIPSADGDVSGMQAQMEMVTAMKLMAVVSSAIDPIYLLDEAGLARMNAMNGEDSELSVFVTDPAPISAAELGGDEFEGMYLMLRTYCSDAEYYEFCKKLMQALEPVPIGGNAGAARDY